MSFVASFAVRGPALSLKQAISPEPVLQGRAYTLVIHSIMLEEIDLPCNSLMFLSSKNCRALYTLRTETAARSMPLEMWFYGNARGPRSFITFLPQKFPITNLKDDLHFKIDVINPDQQRILKDAKATIHCSIFRA